MAFRPLPPAHGLLALVAAGPVLSDRAFAQEAKDSNPGYMVFKVNLTTTGIAGQPGGMPGAGPGLGGFPGGGEGGEGRGFGGFPQPGGFPPPGGVPGQPGVPPAQPSQYAVAVVPYYKILNRPVVVGKPASGPLGPNPKSLSLQITTDTRTWLTSSPFLYADGVLVQVYPMRRPLPDQLLANKVKAWGAKGKPLDGVDGSIELIGDALAAGLPDKAAEFFAELAKTVKSRQGQGVPDRVARAAKAYDEVAPTLGQELPEDPEATKWKDRLGAADVSTLGTQHYAIVHFGDQLVSQESLQRRAEMLERNYKSFYLWNALQGRALKPPAKRLTAVLVGKSSELPRLRDALDGGGVVTDGFYSPTQHLLVMAPERTDDIARAFNRYLQNNWQAGWSRDDLIKGKSPAVGPKGKPAEEVYRMMTLALVDRKLEEDGEYATITREGTRQLYAATWLLPAYVTMPVWVESGAVNLLAKLKGPVINQPIPAPGTPPPDPSQPQPPPASITVALSPGYGGPNYVLIRKWRDMIQRKEFANSTPALLLKNTIADKYFDAVQSGVDADAILTAGPAAPGELSLTLGTPTGPTPGGYGGYPMGPGGFGPMGPGAAPPGGPVLGADPAAEKRALTAKLDLKAQAISWALTYFLNKAYGDKLQAFYATLGRMPRDMHLDPALVAELFCKTFGLTTADGAIDDAKVTAFATEWLRFMNAVPQVGVDIPYTAFGVDPNAPTTPGFGGFGAGAGP